MPKFMLLLYDDPSTFSSMSPEEIQRAIEKYVAWGQSLRQRGILVGSDKLADEPGRVIRANKGQIRVMDGPYSETKEILGGHYTVRVANYEEAVEACKDCPHLAYGGTIEVRQVDSISGE